MRTMKGMPQLRDAGHSPESISRLLNFSDAIVAIAVTLLVLPLVDLEPPAPGQTVWNVISENSGQFLAFFLSFTITLIFWRRHHRYLDGLQEYDGGLMFLNLLWLALIVLFQVPTKLLGNDTAPNDGAATLYLTYLAVLGFATMALAMYLSRHPHLLSAPPKWSARMEAWVIATYAYVALVAIASVWLGQSALWLLLGLVVFGRLEDADLRRRQ